MALPVDVLGTVANNPSADDYMRLLFSGRCQKAIDAACAADAELAEVVEEERAETRELVAANVGLFHELAAALSVGSDRGRVLRAVRAIARAKARRKLTEVRQISLSEVERALTQSQELGLALDLLVARAAARCANRRLRAARNDLARARGRAAAVRAGQIQTSYARPRERRPSCSRHRGSRRVTRAGPDEPHEDDPDDHVDRRLAGRRR